MAYVLNGFWPSSNAANGLFEFTIHLRDSAPDVFYVRVTSPTGVSVHSGRVPAPEAWAIDCKLTLTDDVMQEVLNGKTDPSTALLNGSLQVEGQLPKLLLFKEVFHFALSRFNSFRARWDRCIADEEQAMADRGKAKMLDLDISEALQFLLFAWRGSFPPSWGTRQTAYVLIGQLPDNVYYKGYRSNVVVTPPKVLLRLSVDSLEFVPAADSSDDSAMVMCEIWGKKSVLISLFTGTMSLSQTLALLNTPPTDANFKTGYCYAHSPWCDLDNEPIMWLSENRKENTAGKVPPFLFVRNMSHFDGANDFEEIMRCFDINPLSHHRFQAAARQRKQQETEEAEAAAAEAARRADSPATVPGSSIGRDRAASPLEWMEKLKDVKSDIVKRLGSSPSQRGNAYDESDDFFSNPFGEHNSPSSRSLKGSGRSPSSVARSASPLESLGRSPSGVSREKARLVQGELQPMRTQSGSVEVKRGFTPNAGFTDYEV